MSLLAMLVRFSSFSPTKIKLAFPTGSMMPAIPSCLNRLLCALWMGVKNRVTLPFSP
ncbi:Uncharacterised protein [Vibrio cholerae]|nr:Uncharacterised protein [Vibrio cholerae]